MEDSEKKKKKAAGNKDKIKTLFHNMLFFLPVKLNLGSVNIQQCNILGGFASAVACSG